MVVERPEPSAPNQASAPAAPTTKRRRGLFITIGLVAALAFGYVAVSAFSGSVVYYRTPTEASGRAGEHIRLSGTVVPGSVDTASTQGVSFAVTDGKTTMAVSYQGAPPATLRDGGDIVAEGVVESPGRFRATALITKCPSKFQQTPKSG